MRNILFFQEIMNVFVLLSASEVISICFWQTYPNPLQDNPSLLGCQVIFTPSSVSLFWTFLIHQTHLFGNCSQYFVDVNDTVAQKVSILLPEIEIAHVSL